LIWYKLEPAAGQQLYLAKNKNRLFLYRSLLKKHNCWTKLHYLIQKSLWQSKKKVVH